MRKDKANTMDCPFVPRKCRADKCMAWGASVLLENDGFCVLIYNKDGENYGSSKKEALPAAPITLS